MGDGGRRSATRADQGSPVGVVPTVESAVEEAPAAVQPVGGRAPEPVRRPRPRRRSRPDRAAGRHEPRSTWRSTVAARSVQHGWPWWNTVLTRPVLDRLGVALPAVAGTGRAAAEPGRDSRRPDPPRLFQHRDEILVYSLEQLDQSPRPGIRYRLLGGVGSRTRVSHG